jgi:hypothetical protein
MMKSRWSGCALVVTSIAGFRHRFDTVAGNRTRNADSSHSSLHTAFTPDGYGQQTTSPLSTLSWQCPPDTIDDCCFLEDTDDGEREG